MNSLYRFDAMVQSKKDLELKIDPHPVTFYSIARTEALALERILTDKNIVPGSAVFVGVDPRKLGLDWN